MAVEKTGTQQKRLNILGDDEFTAIFGRPHFTYEDRCHYFLLSQPEKELLQRLRSVHSQAYFVLQLGYFKAKHQFFVLDLQDVAEDFQYVLKEHFNNSELTDFRPIDKFTRLRQQQMILELFSYRSCGTEEREQMRKKARQAVTVSVKPIFIFREIMDFLSEQCIVVPGYSFMQETVGQAITFEQNRLIAMMQDHLKQSHIDALKALLKDSQGLYEVTQLKREPKDFSLKEIQREMDRGQQIQPLYQLAQELLSTLGISNESIKYFASLVDYYSVYKLKRLDEWMVYVYLLCFVYYRYQRMNDNLISTFIYNVRRYIEEAKSAAKDQVYERYAENHQDMKRVGEVLKLFIDDSIASNTPFRDIQEKAFSILERPKLATVADQIVINAKWDESAFQWEHIDQLARQFKRHLRPLIRMIDLTAPSGHDSLMEAIYFITRSFRQNKSLGPYASDLPHQFLPNNVKRYIYQQDSDGQKTLSVDRYEFFIYRLLRNRLEAGDVFCRDSIRFRSFEDDLIEDEQWQQKEKLMADVGLTTVSQPIRDHLAELEQRLEARITEVNHRIASGDNEQVQIKNRGVHNRWTLPYTRDTDSINHSFFDTLKSVDVGSVLHYVNQRCQFIESFDHILGRYAKQTKEEQVLIAGLIAWGTNMGLGRMGEISDIGYPLLVATSDNFIRLETLKEANDRVSNATSQLSIFHHFDIHEVIHSSSDGQKFETGIHTIRSRHSPKYFGLKKGIVSYTMVANHIPVNARIIGANEHESHYVFDILYNNTTEIQPDVHSTDTHGTNEVNFAILYFFGYQFAPRYRDIYGTVSKSLYGFKHPSQYGDVLIKPVRKINTSLIMEEWENIQRIILSLALKTTTQSIITGKLSAYARKNKTKRALWEYDNIIKSLYFLDYIDSQPLRRNVQRALNRGESYHKLCRAVSYANFGKLRFKTEQHQQIWGECSRLIANCIIYYNASILSNMLDYRQKHSQDSDALKRISPVAWQHINLYGRYEFNHDPEPVDMEAIIHELVQLEVIPEQVTHV
ncbi:Tn3 family transposase [Sulfobacillus sp. hq2]|uniref:Tn3 family transposase n=1 Tax=Sulfobacillus sp. hq2 TaxID=2039167 RepID=UPI000CD05D57|nr:Tn3 family transposase [Sulfobacillus sp. hq2]POB10187.1 DDE transposase [Sulfobacillus sp. hq2]